MNRKVDFLIIGTQKAGTTSLFQYLLQHPEVYFSEVKEVTYFLRDNLYAKGEKYYHSFFSGLKNQKVIGSAYVHMLPCEKCVERVFQYNPQMKFIVMLRDPIGRAVSSYEYAIKNGWEDESIALNEAMNLEPERLEKEAYDLLYFYNGLYHKHLTNWLHKFPKENFLVLKQENLKQSPQELMQTVFDFLGVSHRTIDTSKKYNVAAGVHNKKLQKIMLDKNNTLTKLMGAFIPQKAKVMIRSRLFPLIYRINTSKVKEKKVVLSPADRAALKSYFEKDLESLKNDFHIIY